jgi:hypothetical protein
LTYQGEGKNGEYKVPLLDLMNASDSLVKIEIDITAASALAFSGALAVSANASTSPDYDSEWMAFLKRLEQPSTGYALELPAGKTTFTIEIPVAYRKDVNVQYGEFQIQFWYSGSAPATVTITEIRATVEAGAPVPTTPTPTQPVVPTTPVVVPTTPVPTAPQEQWPAPTVKGDVNSSGNIDIADVILLSKYLVGTATLTNQQKANANVESPTVQTLDVNDVFKLVQYIALIIPNLD